MNAFLSRQHSRDPHLSAGRPLPGRLLAGVAALVLALAGATCARADTSVKFSLNFKPDGSNAAWFLAAERGYFKEAGLDVALDASSGVADVVQRLGAGTYDLGFADLGTLIEFAGRNPQQAPVALMVLYARSPLAVVSLRKAGISKPADLVGKRIGAPANDGAFRLWPTFAKAAGVDPSKILLQNVDIRVRETMLVRGDFDGAFGYDSSMWFNLKPMGVKLEDLSILRYADYGLDFYGNSLLVSRRFLAEHPREADAFTRITTRAWREAMADPKAAVAALYKRDPLINVEVEIEKLQWLTRNQLTTPQTRAEGFGAVDPARLDKQIAAIGEAFQLPARLAASSVYDGRFLPPKSERQLP
jgi:NitT/TauT family transport system substrate-binding protein